MDPIREHIEQMTRRYFLGRTGTGIGVAASPRCSIRRESSVRPAVASARERRPRPKAIAEYWAIRIFRHGPSGSSTCR